MSDALRAAVQALEQQITPLQAQVAEINLRIAPVDAEIDALCEQQNALKAREGELVRKLEVARGMPGAEYLALKKRLGQLAATRMALLQQLR